MTSLCRPTRTFLSALRSLCRFPMKALNCFCDWSRKYKIPDTRHILLRQSFDLIFWINPRKPSGSVGNLSRELLLSFKMFRPVLIEDFAFWCMKFSVYIWFCFVLYCIFLCACTALKSFSLFCTKSWDFSSAAFPKRGGTTTTRVGTWRPGDTFSGPSCSFTHWLQD